MLSIADLYSKVLLILSVLVIILSSQVYGYSEELKIDFIKKNYVRFRMTFRVEVDQMLRQGFIYDDGDVLQLALTRGNVNPFVSQSVDGYGSFYPQPNGLLIAYRPTSPDKLSMFDVEQLFSRVSSAFCSTVQFGKSGFNSIVAIDDHTYRLSSLNEAVCTENLTPLLKLLPTYNAPKGTGVRGIINPYKILDSHYHSFQLNINEHVAEIQIESLYKIGHDGVWDLQKLLGGQIERLSLVSEQTVVVVEYDSALHNVSLDRKCLTQKSIGSMRRCIYSKSDVIGQISGTAKSQADKLSTSQIQIFKYISGRGDDYGQMHIEISRYCTSDQLNTAKKVEYHDVYPWFLMLWMHTLKVQPTTALTGPMSYQKAIDRVQPSVIKLNLNLPCGNTNITFDYDKRLLQYSEYPPDPSRGYDIGPAWLKLSDNQTVYSNNVLMTLAQPDFSMPYNVITLTSTVIALYFGSMYNLMVRDFYDAKTSRGGLKGLIHKLIKKLFGRFMK
ncbi:hypothetical protein MP228_006562 [Amoeboaphelidium protococcarum]|nr:hypothetical protein MP228_006562 [Amoeboaphelidium protococcarum]